MFLYSSVCGSVGEQCYCAQMPGLSGLSHGLSHGGWETPGQWPGQEAGPGLGLVNSNNNMNMAADSYIRQFEEAYSASYSNLGSDSSGVAEAQVSCHPAVV